jgi:hypothetical protein
MNKVGMEKVLTAIAIDRAIGKIKAAERAKIIGETTL